MIKYKLGATIPTVQYGNIQPEIELEGEDEQELHAKASSFIEQVWKKYSSIPLTINQNSGGKKEVSFTGEEIMYDDATHKYYDLAGNVLVSGSEYAKSQSPQFNKEVMIPKTAKSWDVNEADLGKWWEMNGLISTEYGQSIHTALEAYHMYKDMGKKIAEAKELEFNYALPKNKHVRDIVIDFDERFGTDALVEVLVSDVRNKRAGRIDRLEIINREDKVCRVGDYKTNNEIDEKKLKVYQDQLSFYAHILIQNGWKVEGCDIFHHDGSEWNLYTVEVLDIVK